MTKDISKAAFDKLIERGADKLKITYLEYYPGDLEEQWGVLAIDAIDFAMLLTLAADYEKHEKKNTQNTPAGDAVWECIQHMCDAIQEYQTTVYALENPFIQNVYDTGNRSYTHKRLVNTFNEKGFVAGLWEEGSFVLTMPGCAKAARTALAHIEANIMEDEMPF